MIEARLKPTYRHTLPHRTMCFDGDTSGAGTSLDYDWSGQLYRVVDQRHHQIHTLNDYRRR